MTRPFDKLAKPEATLAANSSSRPVSWLEEAAGRP